MRNLNFELKQLCRRSRDGSYATQRDRERVLDLVAGQLQELGYRHMAAASLKPKHVEGLVERWQAEGLAVGTIKNRMAELRWWAEKIGKQNVIERANGHYGIGNRQYVTNVSKARELSGSEISRITDPYTAMSLRLQAAFGLRRGESIKLRPEWADRGNKLALKDTWTKGGRAREIPIRNVEQRQVLDDAKLLAGRGSLIPADRSYVEQLRRFEHQCAAAGIHRIHGHRHQYAQVRYRELTGWAAPAAGGPRSKDLTSQQREADREARLTISAELGHEREGITAVYLGR
ncbi:MAG: phage integrase N-terminal domain-containing protein [Xanthomonadales bacterium]|nr:phage integrase N-terminal domain-containing protein [Xanthomonadales bacterium]